MLPPVLSAYSGVQPNGPRKRAVTGRNRNTVVNNAGKSKGLGLPSAMPAPAVSPGTALSLGNTTASAQYDFLAKLAQLRAEKAQLRGGFIASKAQAREARIGEATAAESDALQRGMVGSSADLAQRAGAVTNEAEAVAAARSDRNLGLLGVSQARLDANSTYYRTLADVAAQRAAAQSSMAVDEFANNSNGNQQNYGDILQNILAAIKAQKAGSTVRTRTGLGDTTNTSPAYQRFVRRGVDPAVAARLAHQLAPQGGQ